MTKLVALPVYFKTGEISRSIYPVIISDSEHTLLIDTGFPGQLPLIRKAVEKEGIAFESLTHIVITHHDVDHIGSLAAIKRSFPKAQIISSAIEADYISGRKKSPRLEIAERRYESLPTAEQKGALAYMQMLQGIERIEVDRTFKNDELLSYFGGVLIISTPGHLPGHISLYVEKEKTLIAGDALTLNNGKILMSNPQHTLDMVQARESAKKFLKYNIEKIICYHGGVFEGDCKAALEAALVVTSQP
jgi:glyoxylase-like metal-dependent hydrolase (beta-lactamase superfamily II)